MFKKCCILFFLYWIAQSFGYEIQVRWRNGTYPQKQVPLEKISILSLKGGMEELAKTEAVKNPHTFSNLPEPKESPYLVQVLYQGVSYSELVPPNTPSPAKVEIEVYERNNSPNVLKLRLLAQARYLEDKSLHFNLLYYFFNDSKTTYVNPQGGIEVHIPKNAKEITGMVSLGRALSDIEWLKLTPKKLKEEIYLLPYPIKPGERLFEVSYQIPYENQETLWLLKSHYPMDAEAKLIVLNESMEVLLLDSGTALKPTYEESLEREVYDIPLNKVVFFRGGKPLARENNSEIFIKSALDTREKIFYSTFLLIFFLGFAILVARKPAFLQKLREKQKIRLEIERDYLEKLGKSEKALEKTKRRIKNLKFYLNS